MAYRVLAFLALVSCLTAQPSSFPLEAVNVNGTALAPEVILRMAGLQLGEPANQASIDAACKRLEQSGLFSTVGYKYGPGPKKGYVVTLELDEKSASQPATIDIPGADEGEAWAWLAASYPEFNHAIPEGDQPQQYVAGLLERHLSRYLEGQHVVVRMEVDFASGRMTASFQPENPPRISALEFTGEHEIPAGELTTILTRVLRDEGYIDRRFRSYLEMNVRRAYEQRGMYRVRFPGIAAEKSEPGAVRVKVTIEEGPRFTLGEIRFVGENLPVDAMVREARFRPGQLANWIEIEQGVFRLERPVKRLGYLNATAHANRVLHDDTNTLDLGVTIRRGPLFHFGELRFEGLSPDLEAKARKLWKLQAGEPFDYAYPNDFFREFSKSVDFRSFAKFTSTSSPGAGENVRDILVTFVPKS